MLNKAAQQAKTQNYPEAYGVNEADIRKEDCVIYRRVEQSKKLKQNLS